MQEEATYETNRIDLYTRKWLGSDSDATRRAFIRWNYQWFQHNPTFWLPVGRRFWLASPLSDSKRILTLGGRRLVLPMHNYLVIPPPRADT